MGCKLHTSAEQLGLRKSYCTYKQPHCMQMYDNKGMTHIWLVTISPWTVVQQKYLGSTHKTLTCKFSWATRRCSSSYSVRSCNIPAWPLPYSSSCKYMRVQALSLWGRCMWHYKDYHKEIGCNFWLNGWLYSACRRMARAPAALNCQLTQACSTQVREKIPSAKDQVHLTFFNKVSLYANHYLQ